MVSFSAITLLALPLAASALVPARSLSHDHDHAHDSKRMLPGTWYHDEDHPVHALFRRDITPTTDGVTYAAVGSSQWSSVYPPGPPTALDPTAMPSAWLDALNAAVARGAIPNIPVSTGNGEDNPTYPTGFDPTSDEVCSGTEKCRIPGDIWDAPSNALLIAFDDGPTPASDGLSDFLATSNQPATHFIIGSHIIWYPDQFTRIFEAGDDIAVHTYTHPYMTTQSNELVVAELGWTMQLIHNSTGGRLPRFWRPPYGDTDRRVSAIAKEVFGLTTVVWNQDTEDWSLTDTPPGTTQAAIASSMKTWLNGPKSPGLIILEHELSNDSVAAFKAAYPLMTTTGWNVGSLARVLGNDTGVYQNAASATSSVQRVDNILDGAAAAGGSSSAAAQGSTPTGSTSNSNNGSGGGSSSGSSSAGASGPSTTPAKTGDASRLRGFGFVGTSLLLIFTLWT